MAVGGGKTRPHKRRPASDLAQDVLPLLAARRGAAGECRRADRQPEAVGARAARALARADRAVVRGPAAVRCLLAARSGTLGIALCHGLPGVGSLALAALRRAA